MALVTPEKIDVVYVSPPKFNSFKKARMSSCDDFTEKTAVEIRDAEICKLREESNMWKAKFEEVHSELLCTRLTVESLKCNANTFKYYTGLDYNTFQTLFEYLDQYLPDMKKSRLSAINQLFATLVKLRLNLPFENLADQIGLAPSTVHSIFWKWMDLLYMKLSFLVQWPHPDASKATLPSIFKQYFPRLTGIMYCFEICIDRPKLLETRVQLFSNYKKHSTVKVFIVCNTLGAITFISSAYGGRISDAELVRSSGFISPKYHNHGDQLLADRDFTLVDEFASSCGVSLLIPSFTKGKRQLSTCEVEESRKIESVRMHIERIIGLVKNRFAILKGPLPVTMVKSLSDEANCCDYSRIDTTLMVTAALTNLGEGIVYKI